MPLEKGSYIEVADSAQAALRAKKRRQIVEKSVQKKGLHSLEEMQARLVVTPGIARAGKGIWGAERKLSLIHI